jgi:hypothetical protein
VAEVQFIQSHAGASVAVTHFFFRLICGIVTGKLREHTLADPNIVISSLSRTTRVDGQDYKIDIYRLENETSWSLEVVDRHGTSTVWDDQFDSDQAALDEVLRAIREEGAAAFQENAKVIPFPRR